MYEVIGIVAVRWLSRGNVAGHTRGLKPAPHYELVSAALKRCATQKKSPAYGAGMMAVAEFESVLSKPLVESYAVT